MATNPQLSGVPRSEARQMWHVTLTVGGRAQVATEVREALERLAHERPFLLSGRYGPDRAEVRYWEEAESLQDAAALALRLWGEHRTSASLPAWELLGLEVVDQETFHRRGQRGELTVRLAPAGGVRPF